MLSSHFGQHLSCFFLFSKLIITFLITEIYGQGVPPELRTGRVGNPGLKLRFNNNGVGYLEEIAMRAVNRMIPRVQMPARRQPINQGRIEGFVDITNMRIVGYRKPKFYRLELEPPNKMVFRVEKMGLKAQGNFGGTFKLAIIPIETSGKFEVTLGNVDLAITTVISANRNGYPQIRVESCDANVESADIEMYNAGALMDAVLNMMRRSITRRMQPELEEQICGMTGQMINTNVNQALQTMPLVVPMGDNLKIGGILAQALQKKGLWLDYRMMRQPKMTKSDMTADLKGEISWQGQGHTPFYPNDMPQLPHAGRRMLQIQGSDYIVNSMLYHAWKNKMLDVSVDGATNPAIGRQLRTTCDGGDIIEFCIGDVLPGLAEQFPEQELSLQFIPNEQPLLIFYPGRAQLTAKGRLEMFISNPRTRQSRHAASNSIDLKADAKLWMEGDRAKGNLTINQMDIRLLQSHVPGIDADAIQDLSAFSAQILEDAASANMRKGIPLPVIKGIKLRHPQMTIGDRAVLVQTYFLLHEGRFNQLQRINGGAARARTVRTVRRRQLKF